MSVIHHLHNQNIFIKKTQSETCVSSIFEILLMKYRGCRGIALQETYIKIIVMEYTDILVKLLPSGELQKASKRCYNKALKRSTSSFINTTKTFKACFGRIFHIQQEAHMNEVLAHVKRRTKEKNDREELEEKLEKKSEIVRRREKAITMYLREQKDEKAQEEIDKGKI
ncbi:hypothetical protein EIN_517480 [Entamoeba invadens IP1]|uniref:Uncharacterized protein n=1 Tax=Entamoeba invadens IP1 TaxID=370355 RepID=L7FMU1_ENTIV|nr:hypothetical protein EIN_517480 [Entamoeba invadens IP1]ELP86812.1 hypothetical protein EIN_517480 [Entamoeba invadens IP1]|eukprot:XP_004253583.1 hypothetical protein EIN_517480 [Entamoeba invadens IP1]